MGLSFRSFKSLKWTWKHIWLCCFSFWCLNQVKKNQLLIKRSSTLTFGWHDNLGNCWYPPCPPTVLLPKSYGPTTLWLVCKTVSGQRRRGYLEFCVRMRSLSSKSNMHAESEIMPISQIRIWCAWNIPWLSDPGGVTFLGKNHSCFAIFLKFFF